MAPSPGQMTVALAPVLRWTMATVFIVAGVNNALDPAATIQSIANYRLLPGLLVLLTGLYVPWLEIGCGWALLTRRLQSGAWMLAILLSAGFVIFTGSAWWRGLDIACGCFGTNGSASQLPWMTALDAAMLLISVYGLRYHLRRRVPSGSPVEDTPKQ